MRAQRVDVGTLRPATRRPDGTIICDGYLTRCGVLEYVQPDGSIRRELRPREEVANPASLATLEGRPVTDDHPSHMLTADDAKQFTKGALASPAKMDGDHVYSRLSVLDRNMVGKMDGGVQELSCGYECDLDEQSGVDPVYGRYDAIQRNINYNHVAILPRGRAGTARVRMDGVCVQVGEVATPHAHAIITPVSVARTDMQKPSATAVVDPNDLANRNAAGKTSLPAAANQEDAIANIAGAGRQPAEVPGTTDPDDPDYDCMQDAGKPDAYDVSYQDGELTAAARDKIKASNFAVPDKEKLPIHDAPHVRAAMSRFGQTDFSSADEKHAAFNRIKAKAKTLGVSSKGFEKAHEGKLDRLDHIAVAPVSTPSGESTMTEAEIKKLQADLAAANTRADAAEQNAKKDAEQAEKARVDAAALETRVRERVALVTAATQILGGDKDHALRADGSQRTDREIKEAVIKHVDHDDVPAGKPDAYVDAMYDGACKRFKRGDRASQLVREQAEAQRPAVGAAAATAHNDAADDAALTDERASREKMRKDSRESWKTTMPEARTKAQALKETN